jgi:branched-chain amino acid transport system substrate-binding protein
VTNFYYLTYASVYGDDPNAGVKSLIAALKRSGHAPQTGGFVTGAAAIDGIAAALRRAHGSTNGATLAGIIEKFHKQPTISGLVSFSPQLHSVFGRQYRVIKINNNTARLVAVITAQKVANIHG